MFAHAGDSDDEDEDRENLVGAVEDSDDEENERRVTKQKNYEMLRERANQRKGLRKFVKNVFVFLLTFQVQEEEVKTVLKTSCCERSRESVRTSCAVSAKTRRSAS